MKDYLAPNFRKTVAMTCYTCEYGMACLDTDQEELCKKYGFKICDYELDVDPDYQVCDAWEGSHDICKECNGTGKVKREVLDLS